MLLIGGAVAVGALRLSQDADPIDGQGLLAFVRQGDLYLANPDGTGVAVVAHVDGSSLSSPTWSPDGRWVVVQTPEPAILVLDTSTGELRRLTAGSISVLASDLGPSPVGGWSPDGRELAFLSPHGGIAFASVPDGTVRTLPGWPERSDPFPAPVAWSPDGRWIVTRSLTEAGQASLVRIDPLSGDAHPITPPSEFWDVWPTWSPDSDRIAFSRNNRHLDGIWVATLDGSDPREIVAAESGPIWPMWSPDGAWIAFKALDRSVRPDDLEVVRPDGTDRRRLAGGVDRIVGWTADGSAIGYTVATDAQHAELHLVAVADGSDRVLPVPADGSEFTWARPAGDKPGAARPALPMSPSATNPPHGDIVGPPPAEPVRPDAAWPGIAYRVQDGDSDCTVAVLRFPDQVTVLPVGTVPTAA